MFAKKQKVKDYIGKTVLVKIKSYTYDEKLEPERKWKLEEVVIKKISPKGNYVGVTTYYSWYKCDWYPVDEVVIIEEITPLEPKPYESQIIKNAVRTIIKSLHDGSNYKATLMCALAMLDDEAELLYAKDPERAFAFIVTESE